MRSLTTKIATTVFFAFATVTAFPRFGNAQCQKRYSDKWFDENEQSEIDFARQWYPMYTAALREVAYQTSKAAEQSDDRKQRMKAMIGSLILCGGSNELVEMHENALRDVRGCPRYQGMMMSMLKIVRQLTEKACRFSKEFISDPDKRRRFVTFGRKKAKKLFEELSVKAGQRIQAGIMTQQLGLQIYGRMREMERETIRQGNRRARRSAQSRAESGSAVTPRWIRQSVSNPSLWFIESAP